MEVEGFFGQVEESDDSTSTRSDALRLVVCLEVPDVVRASQARYFIGTNVDRNYW